MKYIDNRYKDTIPTSGSIDFSMHIDLGIKFQQEFTKQLSIYPCFNVVDRDCVLNNIFDVATKFKGLVLTNISQEGIDDANIEDSIEHITSVFIRFMLKTIARGYDLMSSEYSETGYFKIPSTFKLEKYFNININTDSPLELAKFYSELPAEAIYVRVPNMAIEWEFNACSQQYKVVHGFRVGLKIKEGIHSNENI